MRFTSMVTFGRILTTAAALGLAAAARAQPAADPFARFETEIEAFAERDLAAALPDGETMFVGSSSVRLWDVKGSFPKIKAVNRGFGGATTPDVLHFYPQVLAKHKPATVVVYVGDNDIAAGTPPATVAADIITLLARLRGDLPKARIVYLSIKPSPARWRLWGRMQEVNFLVRARREDALAFDYIDTTAALLDAQGRPDASLFGPDGLHMNPTGYARWTALVDAWLAGPLAPATPLEEAQPLTKRQTASSDPSATKR